MRVMMGVCGDAVQDLLRNPRASAFTLDSKETAMKSVRVGIHNAAKRAYGISVGEDEDSASEFSGILGIFVGLVKFSPSDGVRVLLTCTVSVEVVSLVSGSTAHRRTFCTTTLTWLSLSFLDWLNTKWFKVAP